MEPKFTVSETFKTGWKCTKSQIWILAGLLIGYLILSFTLSIFGMPFKDELIGGAIVSIISILFSIVFSLGYLKNIFQTLDGEEPQFSAYGQQSKNIINYFCASIIMTIAVTIGLVLLVIPGIYVLLRLQFFQAFIVEEHAGIMESLKKSWAITEGQFIPLLLVGLLYIGIIIVGFILFGIGLFVAYPLIYLMYAYVFRQLNTPLQIIE